MRPYRYPRLEQSLDDSLRVLAAQSDIQLSVHCERRRLGVGTQLSKSFGCTTGPHDEPQTSEFSFKLALACEVLPPTAEGLPMFIFELSTAARRAWRWRNPRRGYVPAQPASVLPGEVIVVAFEECASIDKAQVGPA